MMKLLTLHRQSCITSVDFAEMVVLTEVEDDRRR